MNRLGNQTSPYLLQHAHNPVDWYPWGQEALEKAKTENKPILVSIGYSACHWCHVMEKESFESKPIAELMNRYFVNIKVDREERPDVDSIYMEAVQLMGVRGGWPLNVFLMPDGKPFYGGTYFPPKNWANLLQSVFRAFIEQNEQLQESANGFAVSLQKKDSERYKMLPLAQASEVHFSEEDFEKLMEQISMDFDYERGGEKRVPKFPMPSVWQAVLHLTPKSPLHKRGNLNVPSSRVSDGTTHAWVGLHLHYTLTRIAIGGIFDHVGGGWTRYSTDGEWKVPHFEKMLYDNGQLVSLYAQAAIFFKDKEPFEVAQWAVDKTIGWLEREMTSPEGGFYSAQDADSEGQEGKFYVWKEAEIDEILGVDAQWFAKIYAIYEEGNWEHEQNILHLSKLPSAAQWEAMQPLLNKLFVRRNKRIKPGLDNKILCSWNGLMLNGLVEAYQAFGNESYKALALRNAHFILEKLTQKVTDADGNEAIGLWHLYEPHPERQKTLGFLEDYAAVVEAFINLYQITFDEKWLDNTALLTNYAIANFYDAEEGLFYFTDSQAEALIARKKEIFDNVIPSSNSMMAKNCFKLGILLDRPDLKEIAEKMLYRVKDMLITNAQWMSNWIDLALLISRPMAEIAIVGPEALAFKKDLDGYYYPNKLVVGTTSASNLPLLQGRVAIQGKTTCYVCYDKACQLPVTSVAEAIKLLV